jgi:DNA replicative helicase MCM subunit Mcm2 (Cdc46/Mcm family)
MKYRNVVLIDEQIGVVEEFLNKYTLSDLLLTSKAEFPYVIIDFKLLAEYNPDVCDLVINEPLNFLQVVTIAAKNLTSVENVKARIKNLTNTQNIPIRNIRSKHLGQLITIEGFVLSSRP